MIVYRWLPWWAFLFLLSPGCVQPEAVVVQSGAIVAEIAPRLEAIKAEVVAVKTEIVQKLDVAIKDLSAGRDLNNTSTNINASGSGWPLVAVVGLATVLLGYGLWKRGQLKRLGESAEDVARAVKRANGDGLAIVADLDGNMRHEADWKQFLNERGLRVSRDSPKRP